MKMNGQHPCAGSARIVTVQGPVQLLNVISVLRYQQEQEALPGFKDILLIGGLSQLQGPKTGLYAACMEISKAWSFSAVIDLTRIEHDFYAGTSHSADQPWLLRAIIRPIPGWIEALGRIPVVWRIVPLLTKLRQRLVRGQQNWLFSDAIECLRRVVGPAKIDCVYACRNTQFVNELALSAFPEALRICYGDGLGFVALNKSFGSPTFNPQGFLPMDRACLITPVETEPGNLDKMELTVVPHRFYVDTLSLVATRSEELRESAAELVSESAGLPITVALTSHLTDLGYIPSLEEEINLYRTQILPHITAQEFILVKGHPREAYGQSERLAQQLRDKGFRSLAVTKTAHFPMELFAPLLPIRKVVSYCSTGFLGILMIRPCPVVIGLGAEAYRTTVKFSDPQEAIRSEQLMILLTQQAFAGSFFPIRLTDQQYLQTKLPDYPTLMSPIPAEEMTETHP
jgi:Alpha-2,8-polysialyltransferase (POLYST)